MPILYFKCGSTTPNSGNQYTTASLSLQETNQWCVLGQLIVMMIWRVIHESNINFLLECTLSTTAPLLFSRSRRQGHIQPTCSREFTKAGYLDATGCSGVRVFFSIMSVAHELGLHFLIKMFTHP